MDEFDTRKCEVCGYRFPVVEDNERVCRTCADDADDVETEVQD